MSRGELAEVVGLSRSTLSEITVSLLHRGAIVVVDTGHAGMWMGGFYDLRAPTQSYIRSAGHLGWAFPAGLGAKCACPDRPVVVFTGDAGLWYHIGEIETAVRWKINSVTVVNNNASGNQSKRGFDRAYGGQQTEQARELWTYRMVNFARVAEDIGALGIRVEKPAELAPAIQRALKAVVDRLDHRMLLPTKSALIRITSRRERLAPQGSRSHRATRALAHRLSLARPS